MKLDKQETWEYLAPYPGAQLRVKRRMIYHYGIYTGDAVIAFGSGIEAEVTQKEEVEVHKTSLKDFLQGGKPEVRVYCRAEKKRLNPTAQILSLAQSALGERGYDILTNNCKHFADRCVFKS